MIIFKQLKRFKKYLGLVITVLTVVFFWKFFNNNPEYLTSIKQVSPGVIIGILLMNIGVLICLIINNQLILQLLGKKMKTTDQFLLTSFSSVANFFGPLQSGPGIRGYYLKTRLGVKIKNYIFATIIQLGVLALVSLAFLFGGYFSVWVTLVILFFGGGATVLIFYWLRKYRGRITSGVALRPKATILLKILITTIVLVIFVTGYYFIELRAVDPSISWRQAVSYTGAANFGLFVSLTPDAIGIRETFLLLSRHFHHVSGAAIISANLIDRVVYALFLLVLFLIILITHGRQKLNLMRSKNNTNRLI